MIGLRARCRDAGVLRTSVVWAARRAFLLGLLLVAACRPGGREARRVDGEAVSHEAPDSTGASPAGVSLYDLDLEFTNEEGEPVALHELRGRPLVAAMMYTSCRATCPRIAADLRRLQDRLPDGAGQGPLFVMWSLDPRRDTPGALRAFARENGLDVERWEMLSGTEEGVMELAAVLGVRYREEAGGEIAHSSLLFVLDGEGRIVHRQSSSEGDKAVLEAVAGLPEWR